MKKLGKHFVAHWRSLNIFELKHFFEFRSQNQIEKMILSQNFRRERKRSRYWNASFSFLERMKSKMESTYRNEMGRKGYGMAFLD